MICLKDNLPVIQLASGQAIAFERDWLVRSLTQAAARAGYAKWWLASHVAESVTEFLRDQPDLNVLPEDFFCGRLKATEVAHETARLSTVLRTVLHVGCWVPVLLLIFRRTRVIVSSSRGMYDTQVTLKF